MSQEVRHDLNDGVLSVTTILSPAGLRPGKQGGLVGGLAPGGSSESAYLYMPLIRNFLDPRALDTATVETLLRDPALRKRHVEQIRRLLSVNQFDGVFIDYRGFAADLSEDFTRLVHELGVSLSQQGQRLGVVVAAERDAEGEWQGGVYDWKQIGAAVDYVMLRAALHPHDFAPGAAGDIEPLLRAATGAIDGHKLLLNLSAGSQRQSSTAYWRRLTGRALSLRPAMSFCRLTRSARPDRSNREQLSAPRSVDIACVPASIKALRLPTWITWTKATTRSRALG